jgi:hypothetical protein
MVLEMSRHRGSLERASVVASWPDVRGPQILANCPGGE